MLKLIAERDVSGYQIIKAVGELTGKKPSTGSVYPLLNTMQTEGWIVGTKTDNKTVYHITEAGKDIAKGHDAMKDQYFQKIHESVSLANDAFDDVHLAFVHHQTLLGPLMHEVSRLLTANTRPEKVNAILTRAIADLRKL